MNVIVIRSKRKTMTLSVNDDLDAIVKAPYRASSEDIRSFVNKHQKWLEDAVRHKSEQLKRFDISNSEIEKLRKSAKEYIPRRVEYYSAVMGLNPTGVKITSAKHRFGSCNGNNSLCFSLFLMTYPREAIDYVVVHELAHIKEHNHSKRFYAIVERYMPDYKEREKLLKQ